MFVCVCVYVCLCVCVFVTKKNVVKLYKSINAYSSHVVSLRGLSILFFLDFFEENYYIGMAGVMTLLMYHKKVFFEKKIPPPPPPSEIEVLFWKSHPRSVRTLPIY